VILQKKLDSAHISGKRRQVTLDGGILREAVFPIHQSEPLLHAIRKLGGILDSPGIEHLRAGRLCHMASVTRWHHPGPYVTLVSGRFDFGV